MAKKIPADGGSAPSAPRKSHLRRNILACVAVAALIGAPTAEVKYHIVPIGQQPLSSLGNVEFAKVISWGCAAQEFSGQPEAALRAFVAQPIVKGQPSWVREAAKKNYEECLTEAAAGRKEAARIVQWGEGPDAGGKGGLPPTIAGLFDEPGGTPPAALSALQIRNVGSRAVQLATDCATAVVGKYQPAHTVASVKVIGPGPLATSPKARGRFQPEIGQCIIDTEEATARGAIPGGPDAVTALLAGAHVQDVADNMLYGKNGILAGAGV